ncbi:MAG: class I mannose-6-phosphate isomerase [Lachnospiraceae bacterium]|nr:class I mannose-6-phosphate isomerase [Lachnospiraceae bacterium]
MGNRPMMLRPTGKDYLWGGRRLNDEFEKNIDMFPLAETWECSTHPDGPSFIAGGEYDGMKLSDVLKEHPEYLGTHVKVRSRMNGSCISGKTDREDGKMANEPDASFPQDEAGAELPILIKFIDADKDLSVQVHPDDEYAREYENGQRGKTEMWYVLDAAKDARLIYGLNRDMTVDGMRQAINNGTLHRYLQTVPVKKDDVFFVEAGTIHALGAGILVAEIQENSNLTYRLYDYDRTDRKGNKRELHIEKSLKVAKLKSVSEPRQPLRVLKYRQGEASELLCRCRYFEVYRMLINTERRQRVTYRADSMSYKVLLCVNGCGTISYENESMDFYKGDCIFVPADSVELNLHGQAQFLDVHG